MALFEISFFTSINIDYFQPQQTCQEMTSVIRTSPPITTLCKGSKSGFDPINFSQNCESLPSPRNCVIYVNIIHLSLTTCTHTAGTCNGSYMWCKDKRHFLLYQQHNNPRIILSTDDQNDHSCQIGPQGPLIIHRYRKRYRCSCIGCYPCIIAPGLRK